MPLPAPVTTAVLPANSFMTCDAIARMGGFSVRRLGAVETPLEIECTWGKSMGRLDGKVAIITGGARGQGEAHARLCVEEGAHVVIGDVLDDDGQRVAVELGSMARYVRLDVSRAEDWANAVSVAESMGPLRVLVNNAAIHWTRPIEFETADGFEKIWRVNLLGAFLGIKAAIVPMR